MIQLECSNCRTMLSIDDAFAGAVCRCQFCGTIQTVPRPSQKTQRAADLTSPKPLFKRKARIESALNPYSDGLARAVDEMESSDTLSPSNLSGLDPSPKQPSPPKGEEPAAGTSSRRHSAATAASRNESAAAASATPSHSPAGKPHFVPKPSSAAANASPTANRPSRTPMLIAAAAIAVLGGSAAIWWGLQGDKGKTSPLPVPAATSQPAPAPIAPASPATLAAPAAATEPIVVVPVTVSATEPAAAVNIDPAAEPAPASQPAPAAAP